MRSGAVWLTVFLMGAAAPAWGAGVLASLPHSELSAPSTNDTGRSIDLSVYNAFREASTHAERDKTFGSHEEDGQAPGEGFGLSFDPAPAEIGPATRKRAHFGRVRLNGVTVLGASVGGSIDGRSANVLLSWPTSQ